MSSTTATACATSNYVGYLVGAVAGLQVRSTGRGSGHRLANVAAIVACSSLAAMPVGGPSIWIVLRFLAGVAGALLFVVAADSLLSGERIYAAAWGFGGVGAGVVLSGLVTSALEFSWPFSWVGAAGAAGALAVLAWRARSVHRPKRWPDRKQTLGAARAHSFALVWWIYALEGMGYIVAGTFLVAAVSDKAPGPIGSHVWATVGLFAIPSCALWTWAATRMQPAVVLCGALLLQAIGVLLATLPNSAAVLLAGVLFGITIIGVPWLAVGLGRSSGRAKDVALMTVGYSVGQVLGPIAVSPLQSDGYELSMVASAGLLVIAAILAGTLALRLRPRTLRFTSPP